MTRRFEDDPHDAYPDRARSSGAGLLIGLLVAGGLLIVLVCGGGLAYLFRARTADRKARVAMMERDEVAQAANVANDRRAGVANAPPGQGPAGEVLDGRNGNPIVNEFSANAIAAEKKWLGK
jgi:uncharacterized protein GlcG (DUF336 family)